MYINILQINVDRRRAAQEILNQTAKQEKADLILVSEPNRSLLRKKAWYVDEEENVCIIKATQNVKITKWGKGRGFVWVAMGDIYVYATYISPNVSADGFSNWLEELQGDLKEKVRRIVIGGDFNAKALCGDPNGRTVKGEFWGSGPLV